MRRGLLIAAAIGALLCAGTGTAGAATTLPVGKAHGVTARHSGGDVVLRFTGAEGVSTYEILAGKRVRIECTQFRAPRLDFTPSGAFGDTVRAPRRSRRSR